MNPVPGIASTQARTSGLPQPRQHAMQCAVDSGRNRTTHRLAIKLNLNNGAIGCI